MKNIANLLQNMVFRLLKAKADEFKLFNSPS